MWTGKWNIEFTLLQSRYQVLIEREKRRMDAAVSSVERSFPIYRKMDYLFLNINYLKKISNITQIYYEYFLAISFQMEILGPFAEQQAPQCGVFSLNVFSLSVFQKCS